LALKVGIIDLIKLKNKEMKSCSITSTYILCNMNGVGFQRWNMNKVEFWWTWFFILPWNIINWNGNRLEPKIRFFKYLLLVPKVGQIWMEISNLNLNLLMEKYNGDKKKKWLSIKIQIMFWQIPTFGIESRVGRDRNYKFLFTFHDGMG